MKIYRYLGKNLETIMPAHPYAAAQPITFGYYLAAWARARTSFDRLRGLPRTNLKPLAPAPGWDRISHRPNAGRSYLVWMETCKTIGCSRFRDYVADIVFAIPCCIPTRADEPDLYFWVTPNFPFLTCRMNSSSAAALCLRKETPSFSSIPSRRSPTYSVPSSPLSLR